MPQIFAVIFGSARHTGALALALGLITILAAFGFQHIGGYVPCELCYQQRIPYYAGLPVLLVTLLGWASFSKTIKLVGLGIAAAIFVWGTYTGIYHSGVEWGFFPGPSSCTGVGDGASFDTLLDLNSAETVIPCDRAQWRFLGLSFAGYNGLISLVISGLLIAGLVRVFRTAQ